MRISRYEHIRELLKNILSVFLVVIVLLNPSFAQSYKTDKITYHNQDLRALADKYFGNADLWGTILKYNDLKSPVELREGMELIIPSELVKNTSSNIYETGRTIDLSTENGAKIFTPALLNSATEKLNQAIKLRDKGNWEESNKNAIDALNIAKQSLEQSQILRNQSADATLSFVKGDVQRRKAAQRLWNEADLYEKLYESDRTRTLTESFAEITFIDLSRVRLNENSQALIQRSRVDLLSKKTETTVRLIKGDAFAYLLKNPKKKFDIDIPGLDTKIRSKSFWIEKQKDTKIANYEGEIELEAQGTKVVVKENQGSVIPEGGPPSEPLDLLPAPSLNRPINSAKLYSNNLSFIWTTIDSAKQYWFELSGDALFKELVYSKKNMRDTTLNLSSVTPGIYYWHVASIDSSGFPGDFSQYSYLNLIEDKINPYLRIISPKQHIITKNSEIVIKGETEPSASLHVDEQVVDVNKNGDFEQKFDLKNGYNKFSVISEDLAGNKTTHKLEAIYEADSNVELKYTTDKYDESDNLFITNTLPLIIEGSTRPRSDVSVKSLSSKIIRRTYSGTTGAFMYQLGRSESTEPLLQVITTPAGYTRADTIRIKLDNTPPEIKISSCVPRLTSSSTLSLSGNVRDGKKLVVNGNPVELSDESFTTSLELKNGENEIALSAFDRAGNTSTSFYHVILDNTPPELTDYRIIRTNADPSIVRIEVKAEDDAGMKKAAKCVLYVDDRPVNKLLVLNESSGMYELQFVLTNPVSRVKLESVTLEDYPGNNKEYNINTK